MTKSEALKKTDEQIKDFMWLGTYNVEAWIKKKDLETYEQKWLSST